MALTQATIDNLKPKEKVYQRSENNLIVVIQPTGTITYYAYVNRRNKKLGNHPTLTLANAKKKKEELFVEKYMGKLQESNLTFEEYVLSNDFNDWSKIRPTHEARLASMKATILPILGKYKLADIDTTHITRYKNIRRSQNYGSNKRQIATSTINRELTDIGSVLTQAKAMKLIRERIKIEKFKEDKSKPKRVLESWEVKALRDASKNNAGLNKRLQDQRRHIRTIIEIAYWTGLRRGEILSLTWGNIVYKGHFLEEFKSSTEEDWEDNEWVKGWRNSRARDYALEVEGHKTKTGQSRLVPISPTLTEELKDYYTWFLHQDKKRYDERKQWQDDVYDHKVNMPKGKFVAPMHDGIQMFPFDNVDNAFNTTRKKAGLSKDITLHSLRHNFCTKSLEAGMSLHCVKDLAGHASIETTERYLHANPRVKFEQYKMAESKLLEEST